MKVKIGDKIYDSDVEPILLILSLDDRYNINRMLVGATRYLCFPEVMDVEVARQVLVNARDIEPKIIMEDEQMDENVTPPTFTKED